MQTINRLLLIWVDVFVVITSKTISYFSKNVSASVKWMLFFNSIKKGKIWKMENRVGMKDN